MKHIPSDIAKIFKSRMNAADINSIDQRQYLKWLRYYLDFCHKYKFSPVQDDSCNKFMQKLNEKNQTPRQQRQAAQSVMVYRDIQNQFKQGKSENLTNQHQDSPWETIYQKLNDEIRIRNYSDKTYQTYAGWIGRFEQFIHSKSPESVEMDDVKKFLTDLAVRKKVAASTQNQAFNSLLFLFRHILKKEDEFDAKHGIVRAKRKRYIPVVLTRKEVDAVLAGLNEPYDLVVKLLYGCGLRLFEALNIRLQSVNVDERILTIHDGKGLKDRSVPLPESILPELEHHLEKLDKLHEQDLAADYAGVFMPKAMNRKMNTASKELPWQWLFPAKTLTFVPENVSYKRYHLHETHVQKSIALKQHLD